jgi:predicted peroxiredoxin
MAKVLYAGSFGTDDPTRATLPFLMASGAIDAGHEPEIALMAEASYLAKDGMVEEVSGLGLPELKDIMPKLVEHGVPVYV